MRNSFLLIVLIFACSISQAQEQFAVYFQSNQFELDLTQTKRLQQWMGENPKVKVVAVNGYTDEDGSSGHNDTLAQRRVNFVVRQISGKVNIRDDFKTRSFGELHQQSQNKAENRKVSIYFLAEKDLAREDEILNIKKEPTPELPKKRIVTYPERITVDNPDGSKTTYTLNVEFMRQMTNATAGEKLTIANLNFVINTFAIVNESRSKLFELLLVLQRNPNLKIEIQGHLCCSPKDTQDLSTKRAKAIHQFLVNNEIDKTRLSYKGFGSSLPIFPLPEKNEAERAANRRVEILILQN